MANTTSAQKAVRKAARRTEINKSRRSQMKSEVRKVEEAIAAGNKKVALESLKAAEPILVRAAQKGVIPSRAASRKVSRLVARVKGMPS